MVEESGTQELDTASMSLIDGNSESELDAKDEYDRSGEWDSAVVA